LKRRRVIAVVTWYVVATWVALQVADVLGPVLTGDEQALRFVVYLAVVGFPIALFFGWRYDLSGGRIQRTTPAAAAVSAPLGSRDFLLLALMAVGFAAIVWWAVQQARTAPVLETIGAPHSVAVLKFEDRTGELTQLAEEISDQVVTTLIANPNLHVTGRTSSFYFADHPAELEQVARMLAARHLLTGVISGTMAVPLLRLELVLLPSAETLWAEDFRLNPERPYDVYAPIAARVAQAVNVSSNPAEPAARPVNTEVENYLYLARQAERGEERLNWLKRAVEADPEDPRPRAELAMSYQLGLSFGAVPLDEAMRLSREALDAAAAMGADDYLYHWAEALYQRRVMRFQGVTPELEQAFTEHMDRVTTLNPSDATPFISYAIHHRLQRRFYEAGELLRRALDRDPLNGGARMQYARVLSALGQRERALSLVTQLPVLFDAYWMNVVELYHGYNELDRGLWWQSRMPDQNDWQRVHLAHSWAELKDLDRAGEILADIGPNSPLRSAAEGAGQVMRGAPRAALDTALAALDHDRPDREQSQALEMAASAALRAGEFALTIELMERRRPELADPLAPAVDFRNAEHALILATALQRLGGQEVREGVLAGMILATTRNRPFLGYVDGVFDLPIRVHAYRGEIEQALELLQSAYDEGFRDIYQDWGKLPAEYEPLIGHPGFERLLARIDEDLATMRANVSAWIEDGTDLMSEASTELVKLD